MILSRGFKITLVLVYIVVSLAVAAVLHLDNARLRRRVTAAAHRERTAQQLQRDNASAQTLLVQTELDGAAADAAIEAELRRWQEEVAELERNAQARFTAFRSQAQTDALALAHNRDPEKGLVRLEHFTDAGELTPSATIRTFVWAAMQGHEERLAQLIAFMPAGRERAAALVAALPDADRRTYATPEKLAALFFADALTTMEAAQIVGVALKDERHAVARVRGLTPSEQNIPLRRGAAGWQILVANDMVGKLERWAQRRVAGKE